MPNLPKSIRPAWIPESKPKPFQRPDDNSFYHTTAWRNLRRMHLNEYPLCVECEKKGIIRVGNIVDHITPILEGGEALDPANLQTLCKQCHAVKTAKESHRNR